MKSDLLETISAIISPIAEKFKLDIVDLNLNRRGQAIIVDVIADKPMGGITLDDCTQLNKALSEELEVQDIITDEYIVEVSSPGLDRPLNTPKDFKRVLKREVRFHLKEGAAEKLEYQGRVVEADDMEVTIETKMEIIKILYSQIQKAIQVI